MTLPARDYLVDRFRTDALVLRERADAAATGQPRPGPDAATSRKMAEACEDVSAMLQAIATNGTVATTLDALQALVPLLEQRAQQQRAPAVRSVYAGAATRIREVRQAEEQAAGTVRSPHVAGADADADADDDDEATLDVAVDATFDFDELDDEIDDDPLPPLSV
jgi:hypothetical protein